MDKNIQAVKVFDKVANAYRDKFMRLDLYDDTYNEFCALLNKANSTILELACGPGNITHALLSRRPDFKIIATDLAPRMLELAKEINPSAECALLDCRNVHTLSEIFDGIVCGFCIPYLTMTATEQLISDCAERLTDDGVLYLSCIEGSYESSGYETGSSGDSIFVHYYPEDFFLRRFEMSGLHAERIFRIAYEKSPGSSSIHLVFLVCKNGR